MEAGAEKEGMNAGSPRGRFGWRRFPAMTAYGVDSCPQGLLSFYGDTVREELGITGGKLLVGISFGYADPAAAVNRVTAERAPLEATTTFHG